MEITLTFELEDLNKLLSALGQLPFVQSSELIQMIYEQARVQVQDDASEAD